MAKCFLSGSALFVGGAAIIFTLSLWNADSGSKGGALLFARACVPADITMAGWRGVTRVGLFPHEC